MNEIRVISIIQHYLKEKSWSEDFWVTMLIVFEEEISLKLKSP